MKVLYYYYYLFYTRVLPDNDPHGTVIFTLSFSESLLVNNMIEFVGVHLFCKFLLGLWAKIAISALIVGINYLVYYESGKNIRIVESKPKFFNSNRISIAITIFFFVFTSSLLFWTADYFLFIISKC